MLKVCLKLETQKAKRTVKWRSMYSITQIVVYRFSRFHEGSLASKHILFCTRHSRVVFDFLLLQWYTLRLSVARS